MENRGKLVGRPRTHLTDVACIGSGKTVKVTSGENKVAIVQGEGKLAMTGFFTSLVLMRPPSEGASSIATFTQSEGTLTGIGELIVTGSLTLNGGTMAGEGVTVLPSGATGTITQSTLNVRSFVNEGSISLNTGEWLMTHGSQVTNSGTLTVNAEGNELITGIQYDTYPWVPLIINTGTIRKTSGSGVTYIKIPVENKSLITAETGTLSFWGRAR